MKKLMKFTTGLSLQILLLGAIGFFGTFISDFLDSIGWFGDFKGKYDTIHWGARHYWYVWILTVLFLVQVVRLIIWCAAFWNPEFKNELN